MNIRSTLWMVAGAVVLLGLGLFAWRQAHQRDEFSEELVGEAQGAKAPGTTPGGLELPGDWAQWRGPAREGRPPADIGRQLAGAFPSATAWEHALGEGYSSPIVSGNRLFVMGRRDPDETLACLDPATGKTVWEKAWPTPFKSDFGNGPRSTPALAGDKVVSLGIAGDLRVVNAADGALAWSVGFSEGLSKTAPQWGFSGSPLVLGNLVIAQPGAPSGVVAWDLATGKEAWRAKGLENDPAGYSSPVAAAFPGGTQVVALTAKRVAGLDPATGSLLWEFPWETDFEVNAATPLVWAGGDDHPEIRYVFVTSGYGKGCALLRVAGSAGAFEARQVYHVRGLRGHFGTPVRVGDHIYGFDEQMLVCLDWRTGKTVWKHRGYAKGSLIALEDYLAVLGEKGVVALLKATPEAPTELTRSEPFGQAGPRNGRCWTAPVAARGLLLVRDESRLLALKNEASTGPRGAER